MKLLLDSCALVCLANGTLPAKAARALESSSEAWVSAASVWEIAIKVNSGKLQLAQPPLPWFEKLRRNYLLQEIHVNASLGCAAAALPSVHRDPFDRLIVATAIQHGLVIVSSDGEIARYPKIKTVWD